MTELEKEWGHITRTKRDPIEIVRGGADFHIGYVGGDNALNETRKIEQAHNREVERLSKMLRRTVEMLAINGTKPWLADEINEVLKQ
jgi:hypothetical protein